MKGKIQWQGVTVNPTNHKKDFSLFLHIFGKEDQISVISYLIKSRLSLFQPD